MNDGEHPFVRACSTCAPATLRTLVEAAEARTLEVSPSEIRHLLKALEFTTSAESCEDREQAATLVMQLVAALAQDEGLRRAIVGSLGVSAVATASRSNATSSFRARVCIAAHALLGKCGDDVMVQVKEAKLVEALASSISVLTKHASQDKLALHGLCTALMSVVQVSQASPELLSEFVACDGISSTADAVLQNAAMPPVVGFGLLLMREAVQKKFVNPVDAIAAGSAKVRASC